MRPFAAALVRPGADSSDRRAQAALAVARRDPRRHASPADVARRYETAGAAALSVLTDEPFFGGQLAHLTAARAATGLPVLRKDFVLDPYQVSEARAAGADAVLLIVAALSDAELRGLLRRRHRPSALDALVEVHDRARARARARARSARIVGVNNRDLRTLAVSTRDRRSSWPPSIPDDVVAVAESGIRERRRPAAAARRRLRRRASSAST